MRRYDAVHQQPQKTLDDGREKSEGLAIVLNTAFLPQDHHKNRVGVNPLVGGRGFEDASSSLPAILYSILPVLTYDLLAAGLTLILVRFQVDVRSSIGFSPRRGTG